MYVYMSTSAFLYTGIIYMEYSAHYSNNLISDNIKPEYKQSSL